MIVEQLTDPTAEDLADILNMFRKIPGRTCSAKNYLKYLQLGWNRSVAVFVVRKDEKIVGFTQASAPSILDPATAWLPYSYNGPESDKESAQKAVRLAETWMKQLGATKWRMNTIRNPKAMTRAWGLDISKEVLMEKSIL